MGDNSEDKYWSKKTPYDLRLMIKGGDADTDRAISELVKRPNVNTGYLIDAIIDAPCYSKKKVIDAVISAKQSELDISDLLNIIDHLADCIR